MSRPEKETCVPPPPGHNITEELSHPEKETCVIPLLHSVTKHTPTQTRHGCNSTRDTMPGAFSFASDLSGLMPGINCQIHRRMLSQKLWWSRSARFSALQRTEQIKLCVFTHVTKRQCYCWRSALSAAVVTFISVADPACFRWSCK